MRRIHIQIHPDLLSALDNEVTKDQVVDPYVTRSSYIREALYERLYPSRPFLDIPSDLLAIFSDLAASKGEPMGVMLTEAIRRFVVEEARVDRVKATRTEEVYTNQRKRSEELRAKLGDEQRKKYEKVKRVLASEKGDDS